VTLGATIAPLNDQIDASSRHSVAVRAVDGSLTYGELSARAEQVAGRLRQLGVKPGDLVGLCLDRSASLVVGALGIFYADCAYVAIDPTYPEERIRWMLEDSGAVAVVCDADTADAVGLGHGRPAVVMAGGGEMGDGPVPDGADTPRRRPRSTDLAYVVYTSGSTGRPKGVMVEHASLANLVEWHRDTFSLTSQDRCSQIASPGFDAAVWEIWPCLASGASLHVVPDEVRLDPLALRDWLVAERISITFLPTAVAESVMGLTWPEDCALRYLLTGGDVLTRRPPAGLGFAVINNYGLSETTVVATSGPVGAEEEGVPSIGRPIAGVLAQVVDARLRPVGIGGVGELVIGGVVVGRGYLNRPDLTTELFLDDDQGRWYRTGDRVRLRPDGAFDFLGRLDDQVSIRGIRVEPGEVIAVLNAHPAIGASVVIGVGSSSIDRQLVAYVVDNGDRRPDDGELDEFLGRLLPEHLVPSHYVWLPALPLTAHGKIDRDALPDPGPTNRSGTNRSATDRSATDPLGTAADGTGTGRPRTATEDAIAPVLVELLDVPDIGTNQNFFLMGGHSMLGAQLIVRLESLFDVEISLRYLFDHPTLAEIAAEVECQVAAATAVASSTE
jgi:amino acid adenylation domain-containing protein